jgi:intracellular septation protein A
MKTFPKMLLHALGDLAPVIVFIVVGNLFDVRAAIAATVVVVVLDFIRHRWLSIPYSRLSLVAAALTLTFGVIDLFAETPFMLRFEAVLSNALVGLVFIASAFGKKPLIQDFAERQGGVSFEGRADLTTFFRAMLWAAYFLIKSGLYLYWGLNMPLVDAVERRTLFGTVSLIAMVVISTLFSKFLFRIAGRLGLLPSASDSRKDSNEGENR